MNTTMLLQNVRGNMRMGRWRNATNGLAELNKRFIQGRLTQNQAIQLKNVAQKAAALNK